MKRSGSQEITFDGMLRMNIEPSHFQLELRFREMIRDIRNLKVKLKCHGEEQKGRCNIFHRYLVNDLSLKLDLIFRNCDVMGNFVRDCWLIEAFYCQFNLN